MRISTQAIQVKMAEKGWNYGELSNQSGVSRQSLSVINGRGTCKPEIAAKIAKALECKIEELAKGE